MKRVEAIIKPFKLDDVKETLKELNIRGLTVTDVKGFGRQKGHSETFRGADYTVDFSPKVQLEMLLEDAQVPELIKYIQEAARTGKIGDGKIFVMPVEEIIRVRTGESGGSAI